LAFYIYYYACRREYEELQSYYKLTEEDLEEITKEWPEKFLISVDQAELFDPSLIGSPMVTHKEYDAPNICRGRRKERYRN
jgi:hypothetical protein